MDQEQRRRPLVAEQEVQCVVVSDRPQVQQLTLRGRCEGARVQLHGHLQEQEMNIKADRK